MEHLKELELTSKKYSIYESLNTAHSITEILNKAETLLNNPVFLVDTSYALLAKSNLAENISSYVKENDKYYLVLDIVNTMKKTKCIDTIYKTNNAFFHHDDNSDEVLIFCPVKNNDVTTSYICILQNTRKFVEEDLHLVDTLSSVISIYTLKEGIFMSNSGLSEEYYLIDLLENKMTDTTHIKERFKNSSFTLKSYFTVLSIPFKQQFNDYRFNFGLKELMKNCKNIFSNSLCAYYENMLIFIISSSKDNIFSEYSYENFKSFLELNNLKCGISFTFKDIKEIHDFYIQSVYASKISSLYSSKDSIYYFEDYLEYYLLSILSGDNPPKNMNIKNLIHPYLSKIIECDNINNTDLFNTLKCYIKSNRNVTKAAEILCIHRSTFFYRLKKIETLLDLNLDIVLDKITLSLRIMEYLQFK